MNVRGATRAAGRRYDRALARLAATTDPIAQAFCKREVERCKGVKPQEKLAILVKRKPRSYRVKLKNDGVTPVARRAHG